VPNADRVAVLIDCDNTSWQLGAAALAEAATQGTLSVRRGYGDWSTPHLSGWRSALAELAVQPVQQPAYVSGKNATDTALIIDAMDLLYAGDIRVFFLVSSDSDFTRLAVRLRESGRRVHGIGAHRTPVAFQHACDRFTFTEVLQSSAAEGDPRPPRTAPFPRAAGTEELDRTAVPAIDQVLLPAIAATMRDDSWARLSTVGSYIGTSHPSFDARNYGFPRLGLLVRSLDAVEVKSVAGPAGSEQLWSGSVDVIGLDGPSGLNGHVGGPGTGFAASTYAVRRAYGRA
jgi:hypothetical protein